MMNCTELVGGAGKLGIWIPGPVMLAMVKFAGSGHKAAPNALHEMLVHTKPAEGISLNRALFTLDGPVLVTVTR